MPVSRPPQFPCLFRLHAVGSHDVGSFAVLLSFHFFRVAPCFFWVRRPLCPVALCGRVTLSSVCVMVSVECILGTVQHDPGAFPSVIVPDTHPGTLWFLTSTRSQHRFGLFVFCRVVGPSEQQNRNGAAGDLNSVRPLVSQICFSFFSPLMSPVYSAFPLVSAI